MASLRQEIGWTQNDLAEQAGLPVAVISNVERGERRGLLKDNILLKLAQGLQLTSLERREFVLAASGVAEQEMIQTGDNPKLSNLQAESFINEMSEKIGYFNVPAFVTDSYSDIVLANSTAIQFYRPPESFLAADPGEIGVFNQMRYVFHVDSPMKAIQGKQWEVSALLSLRFFRRKTMRVRATRYYSQLMEEFKDEKRYPLFTKVYRRMLFELQDDYYHPIGQPKDQDESVFTEFSVFLATTPFGELHLHYLAPLNQNTSIAFDALYRQAGAGSFHFAPFPDKRKF